MSTTRGGLAVLALVPLVTLTAVAFLAPPGPAPDEPQAAPASPLPGGRATGHSPARQTLANAAGAPEGGSAGEGTLRTAEPVEGEEDCGCDLEIEQTAAADEPHPPAAGTAPPD